MHKGKLFVISGASGVGKSTVLGRVMAQRPDLRFSVSATTRNPRPGEQDGVSYYFVSKEEFQKARDDFRAASYRLAKIADKISNYNINNDNNIIGIAAEK